ncbi:HAD-IC family P-type ATPase [uncultured Actinomyces sp.]|uniref:HAD-IC family P-type ATPase n=1 Tax=uncultured Actinomyces sp. TaxID=249061 RepID=UPI0028D29C13|nr:HAD-IC family P-type ATPase [uncultured Actinomyces sp.]
MTSTAQAPNLTQGLTGSEVKMREEAGKLNITKLPSSRSLASIIRANVLTLFNAILSIAMVIVIIFGSWQDAVFGAIMIINAVIGIFSELRAKKTLDDLAIVDAPRAKVRRDGHTQQIDVQRIVLDDIVELSLGDQIAADGEVVEVSGLEIDESMLTGESRPVLKQVGDRVLAGTSVVSGSGVMHVQAVGSDLYAQGIARHARTFSLATSEIQQGINKILRVISIALPPIILLTLWSQTRIAGEATPYAWQHALVLAVASVVGMIPQGLVLLTSMNFAIGSATLARKGALVQELPAVEVLARVDALCLDKTGTLTTGGIRLRSLEILDRQREDELFRALRALNDDETNATARAIKEYLLNRGELPQEDTGPCRTIPFSSERKWAAWVTHSASIVMGAPEMLIDHVENLASLRADIRSYASEGLRVLVVVRYDEAIEDHTLPTNPSALALLVLEEDLRDDATETLAYFRRQGVRVRIISGDSPTTVAALAAQVGLRSPNGDAPHAFDARNLPQDPISAEFLSIVEATDVFGRVTPEQKRALVKALQTQKHCVAMTGDGVNDALALKDADLGIAMGNGAAATKAVSQLVLVDQKFSVLPSVLAEGRRIMANMERVSSLFLAKTTYATLFVILSAIFAWRYPFLPRHFTYVDTLTIGVPAFFIALGPNNRRYVPGFLSRTLSLAIPSGIVLGVAALAVYSSVGNGTVLGSTAAAMTVLIAGLWLLSITARPLVPWRIVLICAMAIAGVLGVLLPFARAFFAFQWPSAPLWLTVIGSGLAAGLVIEAFSRVLYMGKLREAESEGHSID